MTDDDAMEQTLDLAIDLLICGTAGAGDAVTMAIRALAQTDDPSMFFMKMKADLIELEHSLQIERRGITPFPPPSVDARLESLLRVRRHIGEKNAGRTEKEGERDGR